MKQAIVVAKPPVYDQCVRRFGAENIVGRAILWAWGDRIYNPLDIDIPPELLAHEAVHGERQGPNEGSIRTWWLRYLESEEFRYNEELLAHRAEWKAYQKRHVGKNVGPMLEAISGKLASPLYGKMISVDGARYAILARG